MRRRRQLNEATKLNCSSSSSPNKHDRDFAKDDKVEDRHCISPLQMLAIPTFVADQTPTPTRFLRNLEATGLFNEICRNSDDFKRQSSSEEPSVHTQTENSTGLLPVPSKQHAPIPSVILESVADEVEDDVSANNLLTDDTGNDFVASTVDNVGSYLMYSTEKDGNVPKEDTHLEQSTEQRLIQVLIQLPNVGLIPVNIPIDALAQAMIPVSSSQVVSISPSTPHTAAPLVTPSSTSPGMTTSSVKQKLKAAVQQNLQHQQLCSATLKQHWHRSVCTPPPPPPHPPQLKLNLVPANGNRPIQPNVSSASSTGPSLTETPKLSSSSESLCSTRNLSEARNVSKLQSSKSFEDEDEDKRKQFLESNRAAANRCRQKKKQWINGLEEKTKRLQEINKSLTTETSQLRKEIAQLKEALKAHKDCPPLAIITANIRTDGTF